MLFNHLKTHTHISDPRLTMILYLQQISCNFYNILYTHVQDTTYIFRLLSDLVNKIRMIVSHYGANGTSKFTWYNSARRINVKVCRCKCSNTAAVAWKQVEHGFECWRFVLKTPSVYKVYRWKVCDQRMPKNPYESFAASVSSHEISSPRYVRGPKTKLPQCGGYGPFVPFTIQTCST